MNTKKNRFCRSFGVMPKCAMKQEDVASFDLAVSSCRSFYSCFIDCAEPGNPACLYELFGVLS